MNNRSVVNPENDNNADPSAGIWVLVEWSEREGGGNLPKVTGAKRILTMAELGSCLKVAENTPHGGNRETYLIYPTRT